jgi:hypothetical protein
MKDQLDRLIIVPFIVILLVILAIIAHIVGLNPAGIGPNLSNLAYGIFVLSLVAVAVSPVATALYWYRRPIQKTWERWTQPAGVKGQTGSTSPFPDPRAPLSDSQAVQSIHYANQLDSERGGTSRDVPFVVPKTEAAPIPPTVLIQPAEPGIGAGVPHGRPYRSATSPDMPITRSPIPFRQGVRAIPPAPYYPQSRQ